MYDVTGVQRDILIVAHRLRGEEQPSGIDIKEALHEFYERHISVSVVYNNLKILTQKGFIAAREVDKRQNKYVLTEQGKKLILRYYDWLEERLDKDDLSPEQDTKAHPA